MDWRPILPLIAAIGLIGSNALALSPIATLVALDLSGSAEDVIVAAAAYGLGTAGAALLLAPLADRTGPARALYRSLWLWVVALVASTLAPAVWVLVAAQALAGVGVGMALPAIYSLAAERAAPGQQARTMGLVMTGWMLSMVAGVALAALVADLWGWRSVYGGLGALGALITLSLRPAPEPTRIARASSPISALRVPGIARALLAVGCLSLGFYGSYSYIGTALQTALGASPAQAGLLPLSYGIGFGASVLLDGWLDRLGPRRALPLVALFIAAVYAAMAAGAQSFSALLALAALWGMGQHAGLTLTVTRLTALDPDQRGAIMGLNSTVMYLGVFGGALLFRPAFVSGGIGACLLGSAALAVLLLLEALAPTPSTRARPA